MPVVLVEKQTPQITLVTLNRPERRNALTIELMSELTEAIENAAADPKQRILILRGAGKAFCTGLDLEAAADSSKAHATAEMVARMLLALAETRLITIATVHGAAVAGGAGIMSACDFVIAAERTKIGYPEVRRGLVAGLVMTFLRRQLRERDLRELLLTSELIDAKRAQEIGLVNRVVPPNELENDRAENRSRHIARRSRRDYELQTIDRRTLVVIRRGRRRTRTPPSHGGAGIGRGEGRHRRVPRKASAEMGGLGDCQYGAGGKTCHPEPRRRRGTSQSWGSLRKSASAIRAAEMWKLPVVDCVILEPL